MLIGSTDEARAGQHLCQVYAGEQQLRAAVSEFVRSGLAAGQLVILVSGSELATVSAYLSQAGIDAADAIGRGQVHVITVVDGRAEESRLDEVVERLTRLLDERASRGYDEVRMASEVDVVYERESVAQMVARERLGGALIASHPMVGLCLYDQRLHDTDFLLGAEAEHVGRVVPRGELYRDAIMAIGHLDGGPGLRVSGQVDLSNRTAFREALVRAVRSGEGDLVVDLSGTSLIDVAGLRVLAETAQLDPARRIVLHAPATTVRQMLRLAGWHRLTNLVVTGGDQE
jgi:anti-anti-sigma factor